MNGEKVTQKSKCWWLSAGGWWCLVWSVKRHSDQDGLREREERERVEVEALGGRESRREGWAEYREALLEQEMFLYSKCMMLRTATLSELCFMCSLKTFPFLTRVCLDLYLYLYDPFHPCYFCSRSHLSRYC